jgi:hypothetical protein
LVVEESEFDVLASSADLVDFLDFDEPEVVEPELSSDEAVDFFFDVDFVDEPLALESSVELPSAEVDFFFFFFVVVLLSELESLDEPLADDEDWAFADFAAIDAEPRTKAAQASAVNIFCHSVFMIVPPVCDGLNFELRALLVGQSRGVSLGLFEQSLSRGRFESRNAAIEMAAESRRQVCLEVVHDRVHDFLRLVLRQAGLLHYHLDEFVHG